MQTLADEPKGLPPIVMMFYGMSGTGKTEFAHHFPNTLTLDLDRGLLSVINAIQSGRIKRDPDEIKIIRPDFELNPKVDKSFDELTLLFDDLDLTGIDTIIVDSMSAINNSVMIKALRENKKLGVSKSLDKMTTSGVIPTTQSDYGSAIQLSEKFIDFLISLGRNLIVICHEYPIVNDMGSTVGYRPMLLGQLRERLPAKFDELWRLKQDNKGNRIIVTQGRTSFPAKSRLGCLNPEEPADFDAIIAKVSKHFGVAKDELWRPATSS